MTEQYRELKDSIAFDPDPKDKELIKRKRMTEKVLIGISLVSAALTSGREIGRASCRERV